MTTKTMNKWKLNPKAVRLLRRVEKHILAEPKRYDQNQWLLQGDKEMHNLSFYGNRSTNQLPACKTVGCIAGWACVLGEPSLRVTRATSFQKRAQKLLGLKLVEANRLFSGIDEDAEFSSWPQKFADRYVLAKSLRGKTRVAVARIEHFIQTGE